MLDNNKLNREELANNVLRVFAGASARKHVLARLKYGQVPDLNDPSVRLLELDLIKKLLKAEVFGTGIVFVLIKMRNSKYY